MDLFFSPCYSLILLLYLISLLFISLILLVNLQSTLLYNRYFKANILFTILDILVRYVCIQITLKIGIIVYMFMFLMSESYSSMKSPYAS